MTVVDKDIISSNNTSIESLEDVTNYSKQLIDVISNFITESKKHLTGEGYDSARKRLEFYLSALETQQKLSENVKNNYTIGNNLMINFMEDFNTLDDSDLDNIRNTMSWIKSNINELNERINLLVGEEDSADLLSSLKAKLKEWEDLLSSYTTLTEKLACLSNTDTSILDYLSDTNSDCNNFYTAVNEIQVAEIK